MRRNVTPVAATTLILLVATLMFVISNYTMANVTMLLLLLPLLLRL